MRWWWWWWSRSFRLVAVFSLLHTLSTHFRALVCYYRPPPLAVVSLGVFLSSGFGGHHCLFLCVSVCRHVLAVGFLVQLPLPPLLLSSSLDTLFIRHTHSLTINRRRAVLSSFTFSFSFSSPLLMPLFFLSLFPSAIAIESDCCPAQMLLMMMVIVLVVLLPVANLVVDVGEGAAAV